jgi:GDP-4-dehydro-6-deoxy-D-mannose reductase
VTDPAAVSAGVREFRPTHVFNLAGLAAPAAAAADPRAAWQVHVQGVLNLAQAILDYAPDCWLLNAGSGLVYGESAKPGLPLDENALLVPVDEYAVTKAAADLALGALTRRGLKCIRFRPFNHTGAGQSGAFVIPAFAMQIAQIEAGLAAPVIRVGNLDAERDFLDVRDVADAYALVVQSAETLGESGLILNIASGIPQRIGDILERLLGQSRVAIAVEQDPARLRPSDLPRIIGDSSRLRKKLGWAPRYSFDDTLAAVLDDCRVRVRQPR